MFKLRPYQEECCIAFWQFVRENKGQNPLLVLPTGTGKSVIIAEIIRRFYELDNNASVLMLTHVSELVKQNFDKFQKLANIEAGIYSASIGLKENKKILFATVQSVYSKLKKDKNYSKYYRFLSNSYTSRLLRISLPVAFTSYIKSGLSTLKQIIIPISLEKSGLGCSLALSNYGIVSGMAMPVIMFPSVFINCFANLLVPEFSRYYVKKDSKRIRQMSTFILTSTLAFSIFICAVIYFGAEPICQVLYKQSDISQYVSVVFINIADCLITISFIYLVVPSLGFLGYIISIFVSEIFNVLISLFRLLILIYNNK